MERNKTLNIVISLIIAIVLWFYVINIVNPPQTVNVRQIPVAISGQEVLAERGFAVVGNLQYTVDVKVTGTRNDVSGLTKDQIAASADVASLAQGNTYLNVKVVAPKGITVDDISAENIAVKVEECVTEEKPVKLYPGDAPDGYETTVLTLGAEKVPVRGAKSDVAKVSYVKTEIPVDKLEKDNLKTISVPTLACDSAGSVMDSVECLTESIDYSAAMFTTKHVQLKTDVVGVSAYGVEGIEKIDVPTAVTIKGNAQSLAAISFVQTNEIDVTGLAVNKTVELKCNLPEGVYLSKTVGPLSASITISEEAKAAYEAAQQENIHLGE